MAPDNCKCAVKFLNNGVCDTCGLPAARPQDHADRSLPGSLGLYEHRTFSTVSRDNRPPVPPWARARRHR